MLKNVDARPVGKGDLSTVGRHRRPLRSSRSMGNSVSPRRHFGLESMLVPTTTRRASRRCSNWPDISPRSPILTTSYFWRSLHSPPKKRDSSAFSARVSKEPVFPIKDTVAMLNFDMVGRLRANQLRIAGNETAKESGKSCPMQMPGCPHLAAWWCRLSRRQRPCPSRTSVCQSFTSAPGRMRIVTRRSTPRTKWISRELLEVVSLCEDVLGRLLVLPRPEFHLCA